MSKHTPGPWHVGRESDHSADRWKRNMEWSRIRDEGNGLVACIESVHPKGQRQSRDFDIEAANVRLIAAAPELLEACRGALEWLLGVRRENRDALEDGQPPKFGLNKIREAIAKAEG